MMSVSWVPSPHSGWNYRSDFITIALDASETEHKMYGGPPETGRIFNSGQCFSVHLDFELLACRPCHDLSTVPSRLHTKCKGFSPHAVGNTGFTVWAHWTWPNSCPLWPSQTVTLHYNLGSLSEETITLPSYLFHMYREWPCTYGISTVTLLYLYIYCTVVSGLSTSAL